MNFSEAAAMEFGLSTHLFHGQRLTREHLAEIAAAGFPLVEVFATRTHVDYRDPARIDELAGWLNSLGLRAGSMHAPIAEGFANGTWGPAFSNASGDAVRRRAAVAETMAALEAARRLGCAVMVLHLGLPHGQPVPTGDNDAGAARRSLEEIAAAATVAGIQLAVEVIPNALSAPDALRDLVEADLDLGTTGICLDFGHAHIGGGAPEAIETCSGHIIATHVHDNRGGSDDHLVPFAGSLPWEEAITSLWKVGYAGPLVFEVADHGDAAGVLARTVRARTRLQAILKGLAEGFGFESNF